MAALTSRAPTPEDRYSGATYNSGISPNLPNAYTAAHSFKVMTPTAAPPDVTAKNAQ